jgi:predicted metal-dependent peptidase
MISKILPLMVLGMSAQSYYNKSGKAKDKIKNVIIKGKGMDKIKGRKSEQDKQIDKAMEKAILKKSRKKSMSNSANTGDGTSAAQGKYGK